MRTCGKIVILINLSHWNLMKLIETKKEILFDCNRRKDIAVVLTRYSKDFQEWWREPRPNIKEW